MTHFGSLKVYEEWVDERPHELSRPFSKLTEFERQQVDEWVDSQFHKKHQALLSEIEGIHIVNINKKANNMTNIALKRPLSFPSDVQGNINRS